MASGHPVAEAADTGSASGDAPLPLRPGRTRAISALVAVVVLVADQLTKEWAVSELVERDIDLFWTLRLRLTFNSGMAFGAGDGLGPVIGVVALVVVVVLLVIAGRHAGRVGTTATGLVIGGALGNLTDRMFRAGDGFLGGRVVDFVDFQWWPVFNVADVGITVGALLLLVGGYAAGDRAAGP